MSLPASDKLIRRIVIVGGGSAGWMTAASLSKVLGTRNYDITLIESAEVSTVGVGEATVPPMRLFNEVLGLDENAFMAETGGTIKLGIHFVNWGALKREYIHPFGFYGSDMDGVNFMHFWLRHARSGGHPDYTRYNVETLAAREGKFARTTPGDSASMPQVNYAYHFDAGLYAAFLRRFSETRGAVRVEGHIVKVHQEAENGYVTSVELRDGRTIEGDLFVDCSGFRGLLIEQTLKAGYNDWSKWLPCNRAAALPCGNAPGVITPYTRATAHEAGWQWRIPQQHRIGNGYVFCNEFISEDEASAKILTRLDGAPHADPKILRFVTGHRKKMWDKNVVSIGLAAGFLEPLESTSLHLGQVGITKLWTLFPKRGLNQTVIDQYNREMTREFNDVKDVLVAHYKITNREDTPFWKHCKHMEIPDSLKARLESFAVQGQTMVQHGDFFREPSWWAILLGQGLMPRDYHPVADAISLDELKQRLARIRTGVVERVNSLPSHDDWLAANCPAVLPETKRAEIHM